MNCRLTTPSPPYRSRIIDLASERLRRSDPDLFPANDVAPYLSDRQGRAAVRRLHHVTPAPVFRVMASLLIIGGLSAMAWGAVVIVLVELAKFGGAR